MSRLDEGRIVDDSEAVMESEDNAER